MLFNLDNDIDHYEMAVQDWDHTHNVLRQDYDLNYMMGWDGDFNEMTYIPPDSLAANMRHGDGPDGGGERDTSTTAICGGVYQDALRLGHLTN
eukprot:SAG11_NODE_1747_length_4330_cov_2.029307_1_plen_93_part_00